MKKRVLFGLTVAGITVFSIYMWEKHKEEKYTRVSTPKHPYEPVKEEEEKAEDKDISIEEEINKKAEATKKKMAKAAEKVALYISSHEKQMKGIVIGVQLLGAVIGVAGAIKGCLKNPVAPDIDPKWISSFADEVYKNGVYDTISMLLKDQHGIISGCPGGKTLRFEVVDDPAAPLSDFGKWMFDMSLRSAQFKEAFCV